MSNSKNSDSDGSVKPDDQTATFREFRQYARDDLDVPHHDVHPFAGLIEDDRTRHALEVISEAYHRFDSDGDVVKELPHDVADTQFMRRAVRKYATDLATKAVREGNLSQTAFLTGLPSYKSDVSGLHAINQLADWLVHSEQCKLIYCAALMGRGKTDFMLLLFEVIHDHFRRVRRSVDDTQVPIPEFATNFVVDPPDDIDADLKEFHSYSELQRWAEKGNSDDERWFIFDEASTELTAQSGANAQEVAETFAPFVKKMRKCGVNMIVIGHDRGDVHPAIRSIASFIDKTNTKTAKVYEGIKSREPHGLLMSLSGIPPTTWEFDTDDVAEWSWDDEIESGSDDDPGEFMSEEEWREWRNERIRAIYGSTTLSQSEVGEFFDVSQSTVYNALQDGNGGTLDRDDIDVQTAPARSD